MLANSRLGNSWDWRDKGNAGFEALHRWRDEGYQRFALPTVDTLGSINRWTWAVMDASIPKCLPALRSFLAWIGGLGNAPPIIPTLWVCRLTCSCSWLMTIRSFSCTTTTTGSGMSLALIADYTKIVLDSATCICTCLLGNNSLMMSDCVNPCNTSSLVQLNISESIYFNRQIVS